MYPADSPPENRLQAYIDIAIRVILKKEDFAEFAAWSEEYFWSFMPLPTEPGLLSDAEEQRRAAILFTRQMWNVTPLPGNDYRPRTLPDPERNAPCFCGSGRKYKQCCRAVIDEVGSIPFTKEMMWPVVLHHLTKAQLTDLARSPQAPVAALTEYASELAEKGKLREAAKLLRGMFDAPIRDHGEDAGHAFDALCNLYDELNQSKQKIEFVTTLLSSLPRSPLRSSVHQRMSVILMDAGEPLGAWKAFELAQQDAPGDPGLPILEINLLLSSGERAQARERAAFWLRALERKGGDDLDLEIEFLKQVIADPDAAMLAASSGMDQGAGSWLGDWVAEINARPLPQYTLQESFMESADYFGLPDDGQQAGQEKPEPHETVASSARIRVHQLETPPSLEKIEKQWRKVFPLEAPFSTQDMPFGETYAWDEDIEDRWRGFLQKHPQAGDSLVVLDDVVTAVRQLQQVHYPWFDRLVHKPLLDRAMRITEEAARRTEHPRLAWLIAENRPALRAFARSFSVNMNLELEDEATAIARRLLELSPDDNHGFRTIVINADLRAGDDRAAIALSEAYPHDLNPETSYGHALALFRSGRLESATEVLRKGIADLPLIPKYLLRDSIRKPKIAPGYISVRGDDQAWIYREEMRQTWKDTPGALSWLESISKDSRVRT